MEIQGKQEIKIAYIGGGSRQWAHILMKDLALSNELCGELALYDIDYEAAQGNARYAEAIFSHPDARTYFHTKACRRLSDALRGADFVAMSFRPGPVGMMVSDIEIPLKHGIICPVGDTGGPAGLVRALRSVPIYLEYAHQIMSQRPEAWVINYSNPMTLCTSTLYAAEPEIKAFGCCHEVFGTQKRLARLVAEHCGAEKVDRQDIRLDLTGVNHFTFVTAAHWEGIDLFPLVRKMISRPDFFSDRTALAKKNAKEERYFDSPGLVAFDLFRRFGALGAAGDRHLVEFIPWYTIDEKTLGRWGVIRTPSKYRVNVERERMSSKFINKAIATLAKSPLKHSSEEAVEQMTALIGGLDHVTNVNLPNRGQMPDMPLGAITETNARFSKNSVIPLTAKPLPAGLQPIMRHVIAQQRLTLQAAIARDKDLAFQAMLNDPLVHLPTDEAWKMFNDMLKATKPMLPGWKI